jgi:hypothetical protein
LPLPWSSTEFHCWALQYSWERQLFTHKFPCYLLHWLFSRSFWHMELPGLLEQLKFLRFRAFKDAKLLGNRHAWTIGVTCPGYWLFDFVKPCFALETHHELKFNWNNRKKTIEKYVLFTLKPKKSKCLETFRRSNFTFLCVQITVYPR